MRKGVKKNKQIIDVKSYKIVCEVLFDQERDRLDV